MTKEQIMRIINENDKKIKRFKKIKIDSKAIKVTPVELIRGIFADREDFNETKFTISMVKKFENNKQKFSKGTNEIINIVIFRLANYGFSFEMISHFLGYHLSSEIIGRRYFQKMRISKLTTAIKNIRIDFVDGDETFKMNYKEHKLALKVLKDEQKSQEAKEYYTKLLYGQKLIIRNTATNKTMTVNQLTNIHHRKIQKLEKEYKEWKDKKSFNS
jgi:hypothetical protein